MSRTPAGKRQLGPYSRVLRRGAIRDNIDGRSTIGRLIRDLESQLVAHVGGNPNIVQRLLIDRLIRIRLRLDELDTKLASGTWTDLDSRTYGGLLNAFRLTAREIGVEAVVKEPTWQETLAAIHGTTEATDDAA